MRHLSRNSSPVQILDNWKRGQFTLIIAPQLFEELIEKLIERNIPDEEIQALVRTIRSIALYIPEAYESAWLDNIDLDDNKFLAAAYEAKVDYWVSLDNDLLSLKYYHGTQILTPVIFLITLLN
ncbi:MAG: putative toxin-antitoxin system toxin component, PIN family [Cyanobacteriota bacterium]|nr:putative toxin-antitoxin system toxin component, PIN family [Cyanobacteriota bacterium]